MQSSATTSKWIDAVERRPGGNVRARFMTNFAAPLEGGELSYRDSLEFNCVGKQARRLFVGAYNDINGGGVVLWADATISNWDRVTDEYLDGAVAEHAAACQ